jgi:hypothetical protein
MVSLMELMQLHMQGIWYIIIIIIIIIIIPLCNYFYLHCAVSVIGLVAVDSAHK